MDNHKEIRNIIHNELKITKKEIKEQVDATIQNIVEKTVTPKLIEEYVEKYVMETVKRAFGASSYYSGSLKDRVSQDIAVEIGNLVARNLKVTLELNGEEVGNEKGTGSVTLIRGIGK